MDWEEPKSASEVRSFLGLANFFNKFVKGFSQLAQPLIKLTTVEEFLFNAEAKLSFAELKTALTNAPVLAISDDTKPYELITDASGFGCGAVLLQEGRPIAFWSYK